MTPADWANVAVAAATFLLALLTGGMVYATRKTLDLAARQEALDRSALKVSQDTLQLAKDEAALTREAVAAAERQGAEATKGRIDATAPRVTILVDNVEWPPYLDKPWITRPQRAEVGAQYHLPPQAGTRMWFRTRLVLRNEGSTTAMITMHGGSDPDAMRFVDNRGGLHGDVHAHAPRAISQGRHALEPDREAIVLLDTESTVGELAKDAASMWGEIIVTDHYEVGVIDNTVVQVETHAFEPATGLTEVYVLRSLSTAPGRPSPVIEAAVGLTKRRYKQVH